MPSLTFFLPPEETGVTKLDKSLTSRVCEQPKGNIGQASINQNNIAYEGTPLIFHGQATKTKEGFGFISPDTPKRSLITCNYSGEPTVQTQDAKYLIVYGFYLGDTAVFSSRFYTGISP